MPQRRILQNGAALCSSFRMLDVYIIKHETQTSMIAEGVTENNKAHTVYGEHETISNNMDGLTFLSHFCDPAK